ncbi:MAG: lipopolysaccharide biosynthesis protein, partial [Planctomycetota bacterium]|nr:lipopolysaccharide biosynthesis protein [Planctomycetota bacterium]
VYGRYIEYYRKRGLMRALVRRTTIVSSLTPLCACIAIHVYSPWFSQLIFGTPDQASLVRLLSVALITVVAAHYFIALLTAMRNVRRLALIHFANSALFAVFGAILILSWSDTAQSIVVAYALACSVTSLWSLWYVRGAWRGLPKVEKPLGHWKLWSKLMPFFIWVTITDLLANLFAIVDRYMIVHYSPADGLAEVGQYHSSRIIPLLMISIALLLGGMITPHLSRDWEAGNQQRAKQRLMLFLKLLGFTLFAGSVLVLIASPLLFSFAFEGKFDAGREVFPLTLTYCVWFGMTLISQNYLFCMEKARLGSIALLVGLVANVLLNLALLPVWGLMGAVVATTVANFLALSVMSLLNWRLGFRLDLGTCVVLVLPVLLIFGPWVSLAALAVITVASVFSNWIISREQREIIIETARHYQDRVSGFARKK